MMHGFWGIPEDDEPPTQPKIEKSKDEDLICNRCNSTYQLGKFCGYFCSTCGIRKLDDERKST